MKVNNKFSIIVLCCIVVGISISSCKKLVDIDPPSTQITAANVYTSDATAVAVLNGLYTKLSSDNYGGTASISTISMWAGLSADEFKLWSGATSPSQIAYYKNELAADVAGYEFWNNVYPLIYICNAAIGGLDNSTTLTPGVKKQLLGEAKFMRAFFYFYLVNIYGDVPIVLETDYTVTSVLPRSSADQVYNQIISDLKDAQGLLADGYVKGDGVTLYPLGSAERVRPSKAAATAMLSRTYLYKGDWINAEVQSSTVISNIAFDTVSLNKVFLKNSKEAIWQLQPVTKGGVNNNTTEAVAFILTVPATGVNSNHPVYLNSSLLNSFELGDLRKSNGNWINVYTDATGTYYYPYKYKDVTSGTSVTPTEYTMMLRLSEQYLIRAEARAQQSNVSGAQMDLNIIRKRAGLGNTTANDKPSLLNAILHERQVELFTEFGHRWLDLKRTNNIDAVMTIGTAAKGGTWRSYQQLYPIPLNDILKNPKLTQNQGY